MPKPYYEAYEDRYRQVHAQGLQWSSEASTPIVAKTMRRFSITREKKILELGCGEGRDAYPLLRQGFNVLATDVSKEAIAFCRRKFPAFQAQFQVADCVAGELPGTFDFVFAVAILHMLVADRDRDAFYRFVRAHLASGGVALLCTMGDGVFERQTDPRTAFELSTRTHGASGKPVQIAATSCRIVSFPTLEAELRRNGLRILQKGLTAAVPDFSQLLFAVVRR